MPVRDYTCTFVQGVENFPCGADGRFHYGAIVGIISFTGVCIHTLYIYNIHYRNRRRRLSDSLSPQG
jgi:hypothetical protein